MMLRAWSSIVEVPYCFSRSYAKFQGHTALKIIEFDPNLAFPDCNSSLNSPMAMICGTKLETAKERCPIIFQSHPSNFKVTRYKTSPILTQIGRFQTIGRSQLSIPQICLVYKLKPSCSLMWYSIEFQTVKQLYNPCSDAHKHWCIVFIYTFYETSHIYILWKYINLWPGKKLKYIHRKVQPWCCRDNVF